MSQNKKILFTICIFTLFLGGCTAVQESKPEDTESKEVISESNQAAQNEAVATFAGGCFWCMEPPFEALEGVREAVSGYAGGTEEEATYKQVSTGQTGHREAVQVFYDPTKVSYEKLLETYFMQIDPTDPGGQFSDRGFQYTTAIYHHNESEKRAAEEAIESLKKMEKFKDPVVTKIEPFTTFFLAEEYHQDFYKKSEDHYKTYKEGSGRADFISENWAKELALEFSKENEIACDSYKCFQKPSDDALKEKLTPLQYKVTQQNGTERAFDNDYWDHKEEGIYVDIVSGEPLFSSTDKFDSDTGWPSFTNPIAEDVVTLHEDRELGYLRWEVRSKIADSHLGHVFDDGPEEFGGKRWCINSAALRFIPKDELTGDYEEFKGLFDEKN